MKFRARMIEQLAVKKFYSIVVTMGKMAKMCVLRLTADKMFFILTDQSVSGGPAVWAEIDQESFFNEYNIEGVSSDHNEIYLEFSPDKLAKTLNSLRTGQTRSVKVKLTKKKDTPCLTFEVEMMGAPLVSSRTCVHDFPVIVLPRKLWSDFREPGLPQFDVSICLPEMKRLKHLLERYKTLGQAVTVTATKQGRLSLKMEGEDGVFSTHYPDLRVPVYRDDTLPWQRGDSALLPDTASVRVDLRRLGLFLSAELGQSKRAIANVVDTEMLHMFFLYDDLLIQYFLPVTHKQ